MARLQVILQLCLLLVACTHSEPGKILFGKEAPFILVVLVGTTQNQNAFLPSVNQEWQTENLLLQWFSILPAFWQHTKLEKLFALGEAAKAAKPSLLTRKCS